MHRGETILSKKTVIKKSESLGQRMARLRRGQAITQVDLAERLGVTQPMISDYEKGRLRLHGEIIVQLSQILKVSTDELLGLKNSRPDRKPDPKLLKRLQQLEELSRRDRQAIIRTIDAYLAKAK